MPQNGCPGAGRCGPSPCSEGCTRRCEVSGILDVDKPAGWTSHDVVARVRRVADQRRVGHAGTLDPFATGVLLVCLGQATRVSEYLMEARKRYRACVRFGAATDTYDATGTVVAETPVVPDLAQIEALLPGFTGRILQAPPAYSALKIRGQPAYRRARRGEEVAPAAREVEIYAIDVLSWEPPDLEIEVSCGKGTYIRSLAHDLGQAAGSAAHLASLQRQAVGRFTLEDAVSMPDLEAAVAAGQLQDVLFPPDEAVLHLAALIVPDEDVTRLRQGQPIVAGEVAGEVLRRVYAQHGDFVALVQGDSQADVWRPHKVFAGPCN